MSKNAKTKIQPPLDAEGFKKHRSIKLQYNRQREERRFRMEVLNQAFNNKNNSSDNLYT